MGKSAITRRDFLGKTSLGVASYVTLKDLKKSDTIIPAKKQGKIIYREFGKTGLKIPVVSMGVMNADNPAVVRKAYEMGIRHFDTAWGYQRGNNEKMVGSVIGELGVRDEVTIATKIPVYIGSKLCRTMEDINNAELPEGKTLDEEIRNNFLNRFEQCLDRLKMDYVEILYIHMGQDEKIIDLPVIKDVLSKLKKDGKVKFLGNSAHSNEIVVLKKMAEMKFYDVALIGIQYKYDRREEIKKAMKIANDSGMGIVAMKTQGVSRRNRDFNTNHTAALKWVLQNEYITTAIPGFTTFEQLEEDFSVVYDLKFTSEEETFLKNFWENRTGLNIQCEQCRECLKTCPKNTNVPDLMRSYMYAAGYNNFIQSRITYEEIDKNENLENCRSCDACSARCNNGLNIASNISQLKVIFLHS